MLTVRIEYQPETGVLAGNEEIYLAEGVWRHTTRTLGGHRSVLLRLMKGSGEVLDNPCIELAREGDAGLEYLAQATVLNAAGVIVAVYGA